MIALLCIFCIQALFGSDPDVIDEETRNYIQALRESAANESEEYEILSTTKKEEKEEKNKEKEKEKEDRNAQSQEILSDDEAIAVGASDYRHWRAGRDRFRHC